MWGMNVKKLHKCPNCGGNLEKKIISHTLTRGQKVFDFEDVPVLVCAQCGEGWLGAEVLSSIRGMVWNQARVKKYKMKMTPNPKLDTMG